MQKLYLGVLLISTSQISQDPTSKIETLNPYPKFQAPDANRSRSRLHQNDKDTEKLANPTSNSPKVNKTGEDSSAARERHERSHQDKIEAASWRTGCMAPQKTVQEATQGQNNDYCQLSNTPVAAFAEAF